MVDLLILNVYNCLQMEGPCFELLCEVRRQIQAKDRPAVPKKHPYNERQEKVVNGTIRWEPIDRTAAIVTSPAPWWAKPIYEKQKRTHENPKRKTKGNKNMSKRETLNAPIDSTSFGPEVVMFGDYEMKGQRGADGQLLFKVEDMNRLLMVMAKELPDKTIPILERAKDARSAVNELLDSLGHDMNTFKEECSKFLGDIRQTRMATLSETSQMLKSLREIRQFFLGSDYENEITRLRDFVDLCERLSTLKESGFLDKISDTMLALSINS